MKKRSIFISLGVILAVSIIIFVIFMNKEEPDIICMVGFGASGPADKLYDYFGITVEEVVETETPTEE